MFLFGCGDSGDGGSDGGFGTLSMDIVDAKPLIPDDPTELWLYFDAVYMHSPGGGWVSLSLPEKPFRINLLAFYNDHTTQIVTPSRVAAGKITQIRFEISRAEMVVSGSVHNIDLDVSSGTLKTDVPVDHEVVADGSVHLVSHFDLSRSIVATGSGEYKIKPVIHIFDEVQEGATICGSIDAATFFGDPPEAVVVSVIRDPAGNTYTQATVARESTTDPTDFCIFWVVPNESYRVEIDTDGDGLTDSTAKFVDREDLEPGQVTNIGSY
jgi:hypothetical protein